MFVHKFTIRANRTAPPQDIDGHRTLIVIVRDPSGAREESGRWGPLEIKCGDVEMTTENQRSTMAASYGYTEDLDEPGGQESGVWVWQVPDGTAGRISFVSDWFWSMVGGSVEMIGV